MSNEKETLLAGSVVSVNGVEFTLCADVEVDPTVPKVEYPRLMWSATGEEITVKDAEEQAAKEAEGYRLTTAPPAEVPEPEPEPEDGPTFGGPQDATFGASTSKKASKKK